MLARLNLRRCSKRPLVRPCLLGLLIAAATALLPTGAGAAPAHRLVLGANTAGITDDTSSALASFSARSGAVPGISMYYQDWNDTWSSALLNPRITDPILADGSVPMVTWAPMLDTSDPVDQPDYAPRRVAAGAYDAYIHRAAQEAAAYGRPFFLRFAHEMNGGWSPWGAGVGANRPGDYTAMWRHVVTIFRQEGATNARWVWSPNIYLTKNIAPFQRFYPGDRWVDFVALDGYNWGTTSGSGWKSFRETFTSGYRAMRKLTRKPMMIAETASAEQGGDKAAWIRSIAPALSRMPAIRALIWFDRDKETDWRIDSSPASARAFRQLASSPRFAGSADELVGASTGTVGERPQPATIRIRGRRVAEGDRGRSHVTMRLRLAHRKAGVPVSVRYRLVGTGSARRGIHPRRGMVSFGNHGGAARLRIAIKGDRRRERDAQLTVRLSHPRNATLSIREATLRIHDDD